MAGRIILGRFGIEIQVPADRSDLENAAALSVIEETIREQFDALGRTIEAAIPGSKVVEDGRK